MIICLGPFCVPCWPIFFMLMKPVWNLLPEGVKKSLTEFFDGTVYPNVCKPVLDRLPTQARKLVLMGCPKRGKKEDDNKSVCCGAAGSSCGDEVTEAKTSDDACTTSTASGSPKENADTQLRRRGATEGTTTEGTTTETTSESEEEKKAGGEPIVLKSEEQFEQILGSLNKGKEHGGKRALFLDFTAEWCKPCQVIKPKFAELAKKHPDAVFVVVDNDEFDDISERYEVMSLPTIVKITPAAASEAKAEVSRLRMVTETALTEFVA